MKSSYLFRGASVAAAFLISAAAAAATLEGEALDACARAAAEANNASHLDVVRLVDHAGRGSYEYWINADVTPAKRSYCRTRQGEVSQILNFDGHWTRQRARPHPALRRRAWPHRPPRRAEPAPAVRLRTPGATCRNDPTR